MEAATSLGSWIRLRRRVLGITQAELASRVPCAVITIRKLEADERRPSRQVAERLAEALELGDLTIDRFLASARTSFAPSVLADDGTVDEGRASVPAATSALIGRATELDDAFARLAPAGGGARLLTITGAPGVGKTRFAMALAERIQDKLELPVAWVELAGVADPAGLPGAIARAVTPSALQGAPLDDLAIRALGRSPSVVVLDNCEHLLNMIDHVSRLLEACPGLVIVATSRARLDLHGEHELRLDPLPPLEPDGSPGAAVELFIERAREVTLDVPTLDDPLVRSVAERVEGIPLAIELAALRLRDHSLVDLERSLATSLGSLGSNRRGVPARHASLAAAIAWSASLLGPTERAVLDALVVFPSGAEAEAIAIVGELEPTDVTTALSALSEAALLRTVPGFGCNPRYVPFVVVREQVRAAVDSDLLTSARTRHASAVLATAEARLPGISAWPEPEHMAALDDLDDDLQAALAWSFGPDGDADVGLRLAVCAVAAWFFRGRYDDCGRWSAAAIEARPNAYQARYLDAVNGWHVGDDRAAAKMEGAFSAAQAAGDTLWMAECAGMAQTIALASGDLVRATELAARAIGAGEAAGGEWEALVHLRNGGLALRLGDIDVARQHTGRSVECFAALGSTWGQGVASNLAGSVARVEGRTADAAEAYLRAIELFSVLGFPTYIAAAVADCAHLLLSAGQSDRAAVLYGMVQAWLDELGIELQPMSRQQWTDGRELARSELGGRYDELARRGAAMMRDLESVQAIMADAGPAAVQRYPAASGGGW